MLRYHKFIRLFFIGLILILIYGIINKISPTWTFLFVPLMLPPTYIINILKNLDKLDLLDGKYFFVIDVNYSFFWMVFLSFLAATFFSVTVYLLTEGNDKTKKIILYSLFIFFTVSLVFKSYAYFSIHDSSGIIMAGENNLKIFLTDITIISVCIIILTHINKKVNLGFLRKKFIKYSFMVLEIFLTLFIGLIFIKINLAVDAGIINLILLPISVIAFGFFFFLILELFQNYFLTEKQ